MRRKLAFWRRRMKRSCSHVLLVAALLRVPSAVMGQGGYGRGGSLSQPTRYGPPAPKMPGVELVGPLDTALARAMLNLTADQSTRYTPGDDAVLGPTRPERGNREPGNAEN